MGYESRLIIGSVARSMRPSDPAPMWMIPIVTLDLSKMGIGEFAQLRGDAKYAGVSLFRMANLEPRHKQALAMATDYIREHAPEGAFAREVDWWESLQDMAGGGFLESNEHADAYGEPYKRLPIRESAKVIRALAKEGGYRRALLAADVLEHFVRALDEGEWEEYDPARDGTDPRSKIMLIHEGY